MKIQARYYSALLAMGLGTPALGINNDWSNGAAPSQDWNNPANWSDPGGHGSGPHVPNNDGGAGHPGDEDAAINMVAAGTYPIISSTPAVKPRDLRIGTGGGSGRLDITSGASFNMGGGWTFIGEGASGALNHNTSGTFTTGRVMIYNSNANSTVTDGLIDIGGEFWVGNGGGNNATLDISAGSIEADSWVAIGRDGSTGVVNQTGGTIIGGITNAGHHTTIGTGAAGNGTVNQSAGTFTHSNQLLLGEGGTAFYNMTGATAITNARQLRVGATGGGTGTFTLTDGTLNVTGGLGDTQIGSDAGTTGTLNVNGGTANIANNFQIGANGSGTLNQTGGTINANSWPVIGRFAGSVGEVNISGGEFKQTNAGQRLIVGEDSSGTLNMQSGGTLTATGGIRVGANGTGVGTANFEAGSTTNTALIEGGNGTTKQVNLKGGLIRALGNNAGFLANVPVDVQAGGALFDSNGFTLSATANLSGVGGITKNGAGSLSLLGDNSYAGNNIINAGVLTLGTGTATGTGDITVADGAGLGITPAFLDEQIVSANVSFLGTATTFNANFGDLGGTNPIAAPLDATGGTLDVNGTVTVTVTGSLFEATDLPLIAYDPGSKTGTGSFVLGTLPLGVVATIVDDPNYMGSGDGLVYLDVTSAAATEWDGTEDGLWDFATINWFDQATNDPVLYTDPNPVTFGDGAIGDTDVILNEIVSPSAVSFTNNSNIYTLTGSGKITGPTGLTKQGTESLSITTILNDYTGVTRVEEGTLAIDTLSNGGAASSIGAASSDPANLVLAGGTLSYTGGVATTNRGFTAGGGAMLQLTNDLTVSGTLAANGGVVDKVGPGSLILTNTGTNTPATGNYRVNGGSLVFNGSGTQVNNFGAELMIGAAADVPASASLNNTEVNVATWVAVGRGNGDTETVSSLSLTNSTLNSTNFSCGFDAGLANDSTQNITLTNSNYNLTGVVNIAESSGATSNVTLAEASTFTAGNRILIGQSAGTLGTVMIGGTSSFSTTQYMSIGQNGAGVMTLSNSASLGVATDLNLGDLADSAGTLTIQDTANATGDITYVGKGANSVGLLNLDGGTLTTTRLTGGAGTGTVEFDGGILRAATGANVNFMEALTTADIQAGGATIDSNANNIIVAQNLSGVGGLTKTGTGALFLNGANTHAGTTLVTAGALGGNGSLTGPLLVNTTGTLAPGNSAGTLTAGASTINGAYACEIDGATGDRLTVNGNLTLGAASTLTITELNPATAPVYVIASYTGTLSGTFAGGISGLPTGYTIDYSYDGGTAIALVDGSATAFDSWIAGFYPGETDPSIIGPDADPDTDGQSNKIEFALGGAPNSGSNNAKVYSIKTDRLLMTIAVRAGTPAFGAGPAPTATHDGCTYTIQGSDNLAMFNSAATAATLNTTGLPTVPAGYEYRTFSLTSSIGLPNKGFMRVEITP